MEVLERVGDDQAMVTYLKGTFMDSRGGIEAGKQCDWRHGMVLQEALGSRRRA